MNLPANQTFVCSVTNNFTQPLMHNLSIFCWKTLTHYYKSCVSRHWNLPFDVQYIANILFRICQILSIHNYTNLENNDLWFVIFMIWWLTDNLHFYFIYDVKCISYSRLCNKRGLVAPHSPHAPVEDFPIILYKIERPKIFPKTINVY